MIAYLDTLATLARVGTMSAVGSTMRISQSAVSKRIAALEQHLRKKLVERHGRRVVLTPDGMRLLEKTAPLLAELKSALQEENEAAKGLLVIGISASVISSWGGRLFGVIKQSAPDIDLQLHVQRSPIVLDRVRSGEYMVGICAGLPSTLSDLYVEPLIEEPMVIVPSNLRRIDWKPGQHLNVMTTEPASETWKLIKSRAEQLCIYPERTLESFFPVAQLARYGFGHGLVPLGVATTLRIPHISLTSLAEHDVHRPISLVARKSTFARPVVKEFQEVILRSLSSDIFAEHV